mmetsp:Transcript_37582/g.64059  ORF Transcript_37582/g.64059 Transcript_37582/m.64059 type:complete len:256 (-) Transcript_37582:750-1517(-)
MLTTFRSPSQCYPRNSFCTIPNCPQSDSIISMSSSRMALYQIISRTPPPNLHLRPCQYIYCTSAKDFWHPDYTPTSAVPDMLPSTPNHCPDAPPPPSSLLKYPHIPPRKSYIPSPPQPRSPMPHTRTAVYRDCPHVVSSFPPIGAHRPIAVPFADCTRACTNYATIRSRHVVSWGCAVDFAWIPRGWVRRPCFPGLGWIRCCCWYGPRGRCSPSLGGRGGRGSGAWLGGTFWGRGCWSCRLRAFVGRSVQRRQKS